MSPDLELFDYLFSKCLEITQETYDYLPAENDPSYSYPFIHVGNVTENGAVTKTSHSASFSIVIDVWGTREQRREVASLADKVYWLGGYPFETDNHKFYCRLDDQQKQIMIDNSVANTVYVRGMVTLRFYLEEEK
ncbi:hypothetical protein [Limosilactobacillus gorillae]|uniref:hypothetical protein n=1 Tax=Limosilactobacillus gorillae TaxID=1450649 RepID=UPI000A66F61E|nr:hypothetical protein [Limosilactobacillus gorillae]